jgi:hypothetical protein
MVPTIARHFFASVVMAGSLSTVAAQTVWDPTAQFSTTNGNPNGVWTYGWMDNGFGTFTPYTTHGTNNWYGWGGDQTPAVWLNTGSSAYGVPAGYLSLHPGNGNEPSILRWTAPTGYSGTTTLSGQFLAGDGGTMQIAIFKNAKTEANTLWTATDAGAFNFNVNIVGGDTLNFAVFGGYYYGNTPLQMTITGVPEPTTLAMLGLGGALLAAWLFPRRATTA